MENNFDLRLSEFSRQALAAAGEIHPIPDEVKNRRHHKLNNIPEK